MLNSMCKSAMARAQLSPHFLPCTRMLSTKKLPWNSSHPHISVRSRQFSQSTAFSYPRKDSQDRNSIDREATEYTRSGSDDQTAAMDDAAFNPDLTDPDSQKKKTGAEDKQNPLDVSPASPEVSVTRDPNEGGGTKSPDSAGAPTERKRSSGGGSPPKGKQVS